MPKYVMLATWTEQGAAGARDTVERGDRFREYAARLGGEVTELLWTLVRYDIVAIFEAPDDEIAAAIAMQDQLPGNVRTETLRAFTGEEVTAIIGKLG